MSRLVHYEQKFDQSDEQHRLFDLSNAEKPILRCVLIIAVLMMTEYWRKDGDCNQSSIYHSVHDGNRASSGLSHIIQSRTV
jgi:hypothetical protein